MILLEEELHGEQNKTNEKQQSVNFHFINPNSMYNRTSSSGLIHENPHLTTFDLFTL